MHIVVCLKPCETRIGCIFQGEASAFHVGHFPAGHSPTNFDKWFDSEQGYQVSYSDFYEPYVVAAKSRIPHYDERFRGYGMNKVRVYREAACATSAQVFECTRGPSWRCWLSCCIQICDFEMYLKVCLYEVLDWRRIDSSKRLDFACTTSTHPRSNIPCVVECMPIIHL